MKKGMTARKLRVVLIIAMLVITAAAAGGFMVAKSGLDEYAISISRLNADAKSGDTNIATLRQLQSKMENEQETIAKTHDVVANNSTYADTVINDITDIARRANANIASLEFVDDSAGAGTTTQPAAGQSTSPAVSGITKKSILVSLRSPLPYNSLMKFLQGIETNDLRMQPTSVSLSKDKDDTVSTQPFTIEVYVR